MILLKNKDQIAKMRESGKISSEILAELEYLIKPGVTSLDLNTYVIKKCHQLKVIPAFKDYNGFPGAICISVNNNALHGIPDNKPYIHGDLVSLDFGIIKDGWYSDTAVTVVIGDYLNEQDKVLVEGTKEALRLAIEQCVVGNRLNSIGKVVEVHGLSLGLGVVKGYGGHGIGRDLHEDPHIVNHSEEKQGPKLVAGMVIAIEPIFTLGSPEVYITDDKWTIATKDHSRVAHFEHTVAITETGPEVLTL